MGKITEHCLRTVHSEQNAICQAAKRGIVIAGAGLYQDDAVQNMRDASRKLRDSKSRLRAKYQLSEETEKMFAEAGVKLEYKYDEIQPYE